MNHEYAQETLTLKFSKDITSVTAPALLEEIKELIAANQESKILIADLTTVNMIDSQGLNLLVGLYQETGRLGWEFQITGANPSIKRLLSFVKLDEIFGMTA